MNRFGVIMAGGGGTRFWPLSRKENPKQFLKLDGENYMINSAIERLENCVQKDHIFVVVGEEQEERVRTVVGNRIKRENLIFEPCGKNTAACIGFAAVKILKTYGDGVMVVTPSDAYIKDILQFTDTLNCAAQIAEQQDVLVTIGVPPSFPATGYGYIQFDKNELGKGKPVKVFKEKPDEKTARMFLKSGDYVWNSGMFIWRVSVILRQFQELLPDLYSCLMKLYDAMNTPQEKQVIQTIYPDIRPVSIDYGIMEQSKNVMVVPSEFGWSDVGSWDALGAIYPEDENGNVMLCKSLNIDSRNCVGFSYLGEKLLVTLGVEDIVVADTEDAVLVCRKDQVQNIRQVVDCLKRSGRDDLL